MADDALPQGAAARMLRFLQASSCFPGNACVSLPCACAETLAQEVLGVPAAKVLTDWHGPGAAALARRLCQLFDNGGESQRSVRARHASALYQILYLDNADYAAACAKCDDNPVAYLEAAEREASCARAAPNHFPAESDPSVEAYKLFRKERRAKEKAIADRDAALALVESMRSALTQFVACCDSMGHVITTMKWIVKVTRKDDPAEKAVTEWVSAGLDGAASKIAETTTELSSQEGRHDG